MPDFESFSGGNDRSEAMDPAAFERFKERMAAAAAQLKAIQAGEQKQKKKEDELVKILLKFIQTGQKRDLMLLVSRLLEQNIPAAFIVGILLINNPEMQQEIGLKLLPAGDIEEKIAVQDQNQTLPDRYMPDQTLPLKIKIAIDAWIQEMIKYAYEKPYRLVETGLDTDGLIKLPLLQLTIICLEDFLIQNEVQCDYQTLKSFMSLMLEGIFKKIQEQLKNRKELKDGSDKA